MTEKRKCRNNQETVTVLNPLLYESLIGIRMPCLFNRHKRIDSNGKNQQIDAGKNVRATERWTMTSKCNYFNIT